MKVSDLLVPIDFSPNSRRAVDFALSIIDEDGDVYLLHVIDSDFVDRLAEDGFSDAPSATERLRNRATERLEEIIAALPEPRPRIETMIVVGKPFAEILRVAADLDFQLIVMGAHGVRGQNLEELLFGSTAEKVLRAATIPVIFVPDSIEKAKQ